MSRLTHYSQVQRTPLRGLANGVPPGWQAQQQQQQQQPQNMSSTSRTPGNLPNRNRFQSYPGGQAQTERTSMNGGRHFRRGSEGNTSDSTAEVENMLAPQGRQSHRASLNQPAGNTTSRLQSSTLNRQGQHGFGFGQTTSRREHFLKLVLGVLLNFTLKKHLERPLNNADPELLGQLVSLARRRMNGFLQ